MLNYFYLVKSWYFDIANRRCNFFINLDSFKLICVFYIRSEEWKFQILYRKSFHKVFAQQGIFDSAMLCTGP